MITQEGILFLTYLGIGLFLGVLATTAIALYIKKGKRLFIVLRDTQEVGRYKKKRDAMDAFNEEKKRFENRTMLTNYSFETIYEGKRRIVQVIQAL